MKYPLIPLLPNRPKGDKWNKFPEKSTISMKGEKLPSLKRAAASIDEQHRLMKQQHKEEENSQSKNK